MQKLHTVFNHVLKNENFQPCVWKNWIIETLGQIKKDRLGIWMFNPVKTLYTFIFVCQFKFPRDSLHDSKIQSTKGFTMNNPSASLSTWPSSSFPCRPWIVKYQSPVFPCRVSAYIYVRKCVYYSLFYFLKNRKGINTFFKRAKYSDVERFFEITIEIWSFVQQTVNMSAHSPPP